MYLTVVGCLEIKNAAFTTNMGRLQTILRNVKGLVLTESQYFGSYGYGLYEVGTQQLLAGSIDLNEQAPGDDNYLMY